MLVASLLAAAMMAPFASAHMNLTSPMSRGFSHDLQPVPPCGGFSTVAFRSAVPYVGELSIAFHDSNGTFEVLFAPATSSQAADIASNATQTFVSLGTSTQTKGNITLPYDLTSLALPENQYGTFQVIKRVLTPTATSVALYQCADVVVGNDAVVPNDFVFKGVYALADDGSTINGGSHGQTGTNGTTTVDPKSGAITALPFATAWVAALSAVASAIMSLV
ncbi:hypothetical protein CXG81DRAFT_25398 [Caulochytrium protostelioides]|nr:hypothetical protein CXG81DRAFT_25398 [Caulochytrium protostelioides]|eukprot:RKP01906.1 hypothetical protein CXG81DRAFT_25398 [Caulochytrium protostelioides]